MSTEKSSEPNTAATAPPAASEIPTTEAPSTDGLSNMKQDVETKATVDDTTQEGTTTTTAKDTTSGALSENKKTPLDQLLAQLPTLLKEASYDEVYGLTLSSTDPTDAATRLICTKFLRANANDVSKAATQLRETLAWRKEFQPSKLLGASSSSSEEAAKFAGLGYVVELPSTSSAAGTRKEVVTFNIYGAVKDPDATFGDLDAFLRWRVALMELGVRALRLQDAAPIPAYGEGADPYQGIQVHDYRSVSFFRMHPAAKAASKKTIETLARYYPETLRRKFFVNVPRVMQWMFAALRGVVLSRETSAKFCVLTDGKDLVGELGQDVPIEYGGKAGELEKVGVQVGGDVRAETGKQENAIKPEHATGVNVDGGVAQETAAEGDVVKPEAGLDTKEQHGDASALGTANATTGETDASRGLKTAEQSNLAQAATTTEASGEVS